MNFKRHDTQSFYMFSYVFICFYIFYFVRYKKIHIETLLKSTFLLYKHENTLDIHENTLPFFLRIFLYHKNMRIHANTYQIHEKTYKKHEKT